MAELDEVAAAVVVVVAVEDAIDGVGAIEAVPVEVGADAEDEAAFADVVAVAAAKADVAWHFAVNQSGWRL